MRRDAYYQKNMKWQPAKRGADEWAPVSRGSATRRQVSSPLDAAGGRLSILWNVGKSLLYKKRRILLVS